jgi:hypothetical protein
MPEGRLVVGESQIAAAKRGVRRKSFRSHALDLQIHSRGEDCVQLASEEKESSVLQ